MENDIVLDFYSKLPFNIKDNFDINKGINVNLYHPLTFEISEECGNVFDIGCGPGHLINALHMKSKQAKSKFSISNFFKKVNYTGIDFNPTAIEYAERYSSKHRLGTNFILKDIFDLNSDIFKTTNKKVFVMSNGVLHHTKDCLESLKICLKSSKSNNSKVYFLIGLYHLYGRKPFLDWFQKLKNQKESNDFLREEFHSLRGLSNDKRNDESWFQDQVNHPRETQHTFKEIYPLFTDHGFKLISSSLDSFKGSSPNRLMDIEIDYLEKGIKALKERRYFPGYFTCLFCFENH